MASSLLRASPLSLLSCLKPLHRRPPAPYLHRLLLLSYSTLASRSPPALRTLAAAAAVTDTSPPQEEAAPTVEARLERMQPLLWPQREAMCGKLGAGNAGRRVRLYGWVALRGTHPGLTFMTLREGSDKL